MILKNKSLPATNFRGKKIRVVDSIITAQAKSSSTGVILMGIVLFCIIGGHSYCVTETGIHSPFLVCLAYESYVFNEPPKRRAVESVIASLQTFYFFWVLIPVQLLSICLTQNRAAPNLPCKPLSFFKTPQVTDHNTLISHTFMPLIIFRC